MISTTIATVVAASLLYALTRRREPKDSGGFLSMPLPVEEKQADETPDLSRVPTEQRGVTLPPPEELPAPHKLMALPAPSETDSHAT